MSLSKTGVSFIPFCPLTGYGKGGIVAETSSSGEEVAVSYTCHENSLKLADVTDRLVVLLALGTTYRVQTLALIELGNISKTSDGFEIKINDLIKISGPGANQPLLLTPRFIDKLTLCIASTLESYVTVTQPLRKIMEKLLKSRRPHKTANFFDSFDLFWFVAA